MGPGAKIMCRSDTRQSFPGPPMFFLQNVRLVSDSRKSTWAQVVSRKRSQG